MKKLFDMTNPFWSFVGKILDALVLHIIWLVCCLPIVTFGPATVALYYTLMKDARNEGEHYYRMFFKAFKDNFRQGIGLGLIFLAGVVLFVAAAILDYRLYAIGSGSVFQILMYVAIGITVFWLATFGYAFPLLARFENTVPKTIRNGFFMSIRHFGWTLVMLAVFGFFYFAVIWWFEYVFILTAFGFGFIVLIDSYILNYVFKPYVETSEKYMAEERAARGETPQDGTGELTDDEEAWAAFRKTLSESSGEPVEPGPTREEREAEEARKKEAREAAHKEAEEARKATQKETEEARADEETGETKEE